MFTISKQFEFSAAHQLFNLPPEHKCSRLHGHNYTVEVMLRSATLNEAAFVRDYGDLNRLRAFLNTMFDHRNLNEVIGPLQTSAEQLAMLLYYICYHFFEETILIKVSETPKTWAAYDPSQVVVPPHVSAVVTRLIQEFEAHENSV